MSRLTRRPISIRDSSDAEEMPGKPRRGGHTVGSVRRFTVAKKKAAKKAKKAKKASKKKPKK